MLALHTRLLAICISLLIGMTFAFSQEARVNIAQQVNGYISAFDRLEKDTAKTDLSESQLIKIQNQITNLQTDIREYRKNLEPKIKDLNSQIEKLGPPPGKDATPETESIVAQRKQLNSEFGLYDGSDKKAALLETQITQLLSKIQDLRFTIFTREIFRHYDSPLSFKLWERVKTDVEVGIERFAKLTDKLNWTSISIWKFILFSAFVIVFSFFLFRFTIPFINQLRSLPKHEDDLPFFRRITSATLVTILRLFPPVVITTILYWGLLNTEILNEGLTEFAWTLFFSILIFFIVSALSKTLLAPFRPAWRLYPLSDTAAKVIYRLIQATVITFAFNLSWSGLNSALNVPLSLKVSQNFISSLTFASLLISIALTRFQVIAEQEHKTSRLWPVWLKLPIWIIAITIILSAASGYISLANFMASQVVVTGAIVAMAILCHIAINEFSSDLQDKNTSVGQWFKNKLLLDEPRRKQIGFIIGFILNTVLYTCVIPLLLFEWGFSWTDIEHWLNLIVFGIQVGPVNLSLSTIIIALGVFAIGIILTRFIQRWLDHGPLEVSNLQDGVANSVRTGVGYFGFIISVFIALSYVGVDFTNIAIVAGALSVGIGFGLQSIVNNFVSGLILLVERPVKVGDWVIVGDQQGYVRRISVRSTEIETFDRSSVIIPNSDLITNKVTNWTHGNSTGRVIVNVGVSYDSNSQQVYDLLMEIGSQHPKSLEYPKPLVVFEDFGASSLDFSLRVYISDIRNSLSVKTELRMNILEAFRKHNIEIPFPQTDIHVKGSSIMNVKSHQ